MTITLINKFGSYTRDARNIDSAKALIVDAIKNDGVYNASVRNENGKVVMVANKKSFGRIDFSLTRWERKKGEKKMKKIIEIVRALFAVDENDTFVPDVYGVQSFGANGLF